MRRILTARAHALRLETLREALRGPATEGRPTLLVGPTRGATDDLLRSDLELEVALGVHRTSFGGLALDLATLELARAGRAPLSSLARHAVAARALAEAGQDLAHLGEIRAAPGLPGALAHTFEDLRRAAVSPETLTRAGPSGPDLALLLEIRQRLLATRGLADDAEVLARAVTAVEAGHRLAGRPLFLIDVAPADPAEVRLLAALAAFAPEVTAVLAPTHPGLTGLQAALSVSATPIAEAPPTTALDRARCFIFSDASGPPGELDESLRLVSAPGEARECVEVARGVLRHARDGTPFDQMAVLVRDPDRYQPHLSDAFARAEIPACFARDVRQPDPAGRALLALLACRAEDLSAARFAEYLSIGEVPRPEADGAPPKKKVEWVAPKDQRQMVFFSLEPEPTGEPAPEPLTEAPEAEPVTDGRLRAPHRWEQLLVDAAVVGGHQRWARRLAGLREQLETQARSLAVEHPHQAEKKRADLADLGHLERFALPLVRQLAALPSSATWGGWLEALERLAGSALRAPERVLRVLADLRVMSEVGPVALEEVRLVLQPRLAFLREEDPDDQPYGRVFVAGLDEAAGRQFEVVFVPGLAEGLFPRPSFEDPLLLDAARAELGPTLPRRPRFVAEERQRLRRALGAAVRVLEASYPRVDTTRGRARVLSFYALDLARAAEGRLPPVRELERRAHEAAGAHLGWAAPLDPAAAVDAAEYDLSVLAGRLRPAAPTADPAALRGAGRYLVEGPDGSPNPHLARALFARAARWRQRLGPDDGLVVAAEAPEIRARLAAQRLGARPYSASALARFAACPYQFFLAALVRLRPRETATRIERMDPLVRGNLAHAALFQWVVRLRSADLLPWEPNDLPALLEHLGAAVVETAARFEDRLAPAIPAVWRREVDAIERDLRAWVRREVLDAEGFAPAFAELAFGLGPREEADPASTPDPVQIEGGFRVRGSIDLVERRQRDGRLRITDYKTGRRSSPLHPEEAVRGGQVMQPLVYAAAAEAHLGVEVDAARLAYCTTKGGLRSDYFKTGPTGRAVLQRALGHIDEAVAAGSLPALPADGACTRCDFRPVCGTSEPARVAFKRLPDQPGLIQLRELP